MAHLWRHGCLPTQGLLLYKKYLLTVYFNYYCYYIYIYIKNLTVGFIWSPVGEDGGVDGVAARPVLHFESSFIERRFVRLGHSDGGARVSAVGVPGREGDGAPHRIHLDCTA